MDDRRMQRVFLVDDDPDVRKALCRTLREDGWAVETFESAEGFLNRPDSGTYGCLVLDVTMPGLDGLELQRRLLETEQLLPIVFVTGDGNIPMSVQAIKAGAADFLTKPVASEVLSSAVRAALERDAVVREANAAREAAKARLSTLTPREREVLAGVIKGKLNKQIAGELGIVEQTVKFHRTRIMERMGAKTAAELMHIAAQLDLG
jgi:FixJ family two-component response regulator